MPDPASVDTLDPFDDFTLIPYDRQKLLPEPDQTVNLTVIMANLGDGAN
jgi:iron transport multicopper oxidase